LIWPTLTIDKFFVNPNSVIEYSKSLKFLPGEGTWPGTRTISTHQFDPNFFQKTTEKIIAALYPNDVNKDSCLEWQATQYFQKIKPSEYPEKGFIHQDLSHEFTSVVYLSDEDNNGTCIYQLKDPVKDNFYKETQKENYLNPNKKRTKEFKKAIKENHNSYEKVLELKAKKNRMILFDGSQYHGVDNYGNDNKERLTLVTFFEFVKRVDNQPLKFHASECIRY
jgi:hypothetical protein